MSLEQSIASFAKKHDINTDDLFNNGKLIITIDDSISIECILANSYLYISSNIIHLPNNLMQRVNLLRKALKVNFVLVATERVVLNIDKQHNKLMLTLAQPINNITPVIFEQMITSVVNNTELFNKHLNNSNSFPINLNNAIMP